LAQQGKFSQKEKKHKPQSYSRGQFFFPKKIVIFLEKKRGKFWKFLKFFQLILLFKIFFWKSFQNFDITKLNKIYSAQGSFNGAAETKSPRPRDSRTM
jgi:hypothetical protein